MNLRSIGAFGALEHNPALLPTGGLAELFLTHRRVTKADGLVAQYSWRS